MTNDAFERLCREEWAGLVRAAYLMGIGGPVHQVAWDDGVLWVTDEYAFQVIRIDLGP